MSDPLQANRRTVLIAAATAASAAMAPALARAAARIGAGSVAVFEADEPAARAFADARSAKGAAPLAVDGDRIRFARRLFGEARPQQVVAMTRYADFLLLSEAAREDGYRTRLVEDASAGPLFVWTADRA
jgi:hypothetical protein